MGIFQSAKDFVLDRFGVFDDIDDFKDYIAKEKSEIARDADSLKSLVNNFNDDLKQEIDAVAESGDDRRMEAAVRDLLKDVLRGAYVMRRRFDKRQVEWATIIAKARRDVGLWKSVGDKMTQAFGVLKQRSAQVSREVAEVEKVARELNSFAASQGGRSFVNLPEEKRRAAGGALYRLLTSKTLALVARVSVLGLGALTGMTVLMNLVVAVSAATYQYMEERRAVEDELIRIATNPQEY